MNDQKKKLWESAYAVRNHPRMGPIMHGAGIVERTSGVPHFWLVRGPCTRSVVQELQQQVGQACQFSRMVDAPRRQEQPPLAEKNRKGDRTIAGALLAGLVSVALCALIS